MKELLSKIGNFFKKIGLGFINFFKNLFIDTEETKEVEIGFTSNNIPSNITEEEISNYSKVLHQNNNKAFDKTQNALCFVVIGGILFIIGILFIFLSFEKTTSGLIIGFAYTTLPFYICIICLVLGALCLAYGITKFLKAHSRMKKYQNLINVLGNYKVK